MDLITLLFEIIRLHEVIFCSHNIKISMIAHNIRSEFVLYLWNIVNHIYFIVFPRFFSTLQLSVVWWEIIAVWNVSSSVKIPTDPYAP